MHILGRMCSSVRQSNKGASLTPSPSHSKVCTRALADPSFGRFLSTPTEPTCYTIGTAQQGGGNVGSARRSGWGPELGCLADLCAHRAKMQAVRAKQRKASKQQNGARHMQKGGARKEGKHIKERSLGALGPACATLMGCDAGHLLCRQSQRLHHSTHLGAFSHSACTARAQRQLLRCLSWEHP